MSVEWLEIRIVKKREKIYGYGKRGRKRV